MKNLTKRVVFLMSPANWKILRQIAKNDGVSIGVVVREAVRQSLAKKDGK